MRRRQGGGLVYSSELGSMCPKCRRPAADCRCGKTARRVPTDGPVRIRVQKRRGRPVTLIEGVPLGDEELAQLGRQLRASCSSGGTVRDGTIEIQGDHGERLVPVLTARGWAVKRAGGRHP